jgi:hypothetical protein
MDPELKNAILEHLTPKQFNNAIICKDTKKSNNGFTNDNICYNDINNNIFIRLQIFTDANGNFSHLKKIEKQERMQQKVFNKYFGPIKEIKKELKNVKKTAYCYYNEFIDKYNSTCHEEGCNALAYYWRNDQKHILRCEDHKLTSYRLCYKCVICKNKVPKYGINFVKLFCVHCFKIKSEDKNFSDCIKY